MNRLIDAIGRVRKGFARFDPDGDPGPPVEIEGKSIVLVYLFPALGDAVLLAPAVKALVDRGAKTPIGVVLRKNGARIWKHVDLPAKIIPYPDELILARNDPRWEERSASASALAKKLRRYDVAVDLTLRDEVDARRFVTGSNAEAKLGFADASETDTGLTWATLDERVLTERHWSKSLVLPLRCLGVVQPAYDVPFVISDRARAAAAELFPSGPGVLLVPGAQSAEKRFAEGRFVEAGRFVTARGGSVVVAGAPSEGKLVRSVVKTIGARASGYTKKDLGTLLALIERADAVVTNDTGPMHFAFLLRRPTIAIFTVMSAVAWGPPVRDPRFVVLNVAEGSAADGAWTRVILHHLEGLLACAR
jgi:ADP-heptose:LPS heptosyltransferase